MKVLVNGKAIATVSTASSTSEYRRLQFTQQLPRAAYTVKLVTTTSSPVWLDGAVVVRS